MCRVLWGCLLPVFLLDHIHCIHSDICAVANLDQRGANGLYEMTVRMRKVHVHMDGVTIVMHDGRCEEVVTVRTRSSHLRRYSLLHSANQGA